MRERLIVLAVGVADGDRDFLDRIAIVVVDQVAENAQVVPLRIKRDPQVQDVAPVAQDLGGRIVLDDLRFFARSRNAALFLQLETSQGRPVQQRRAVGAGHGDAHAAGTRPIQIRQVDDVGADALAQRCLAFLHDVVRGVTPADRAVGLSAGGQVQAEFARRAVAHAEKLDRGQRFGQQGRRVGFDDRVRRSALERTLLPRSLEIARQQAADPLPVVERSGGDAQGCARHQHLAFPFVSFVDAILWPPVGLVAAGPRVAHVRLMEDIVSRPGKVRQELRRAIQLPRQRVRRAGRDPDLITVVEDRFDVPSSVAVLLERTFALAQRAAHGATYRFSSSHIIQKRVCRVLIRRLVVCKA